MTQRPTETSMPASGFVLLDTYDGQVLDKARWEQEQLAGVGADGISPQALVTLPQHGTNALTNGGFEYHNFGSTWPVTSPDAATPVNFIEGWQILNGAVSQVTTHPSPQPSPRAAQLDGTGQAGTLRQTVLGAAVWRGRRLNLTASVNGAACALQLADDAGNLAAVPVADTGGAWVTQSCGMVVGSAANAVTVSVVATASGTRCVDNCTLVAEVGAVPHVPRQPAWEYLTTDLRFAPIAVSCRWRTATTGELREFTYRFRQPYVEQAIGGGNCLLGGNGGSANIFWPNTVIIAADQDGFTLHVEAIAANTDAFIRNLIVEVVPPIG